MEVELLYIDGCVNWRQTLEDINAVLKEYQVSAEVELIEVGSNQEAQGLAFLGSPTVRVDGVDIEPDVPDSGYGMESRVYWVEDEPADRPPKEWIAATVEAALE
ncbi:MAG: thioredoxin family protein [Dehalococcoidia bacterium]